MSVALWAFAKMCVFDADANVDYLAVLLVGLAAVVTYRKMMNIVLLIVICAAASSLRTI